MELYGLTWPKHLDQAQIEIRMIQNGGYYVIDGVRCGEGLFYHYRVLQQLLWPDDDHHRWTDLMLKNFLEKRVTCVIGPKDSSKTRTMSKFGLTDYFCFPNETLVMMSSTDMRGLEYRVWGDIKDLFRRAKEQYEWLPGFLIDSKKCICTDNIQEVEARDMRKGIVGIPCINSSGTYIGIGRFVGIKQKRRRLLGDELQFMGESYLETLGNLNSGDFKAIMLGNPLGGGDPLDKAAEPKHGWKSVGEPTKTTVWENRFDEGITVNLIGTDSPNFDFPQDKPKKFPYMIGAIDIRRIERFYGKNSLQYCSQAIGRRTTGLLDHRVITREMCEIGLAFSDATFDGEKPTIKVYAIDASYGGDRCVGGWIEFGEEAVTKRTIVKVGWPTVIPIMESETVMPEDQIALFVKSACEGNGIPASHVFFDSTGKGSLGNAFSRIWSPETNCVEFGGNPSDRPVTMDMWLVDPVTGERRLKKCSEHYSKFVTELWFAVRYAIEGKQIRCLPKEIADEFAMREWGWVKGNKIELEKKELTKKRMNRSPDLADFLAIAIEGARRMGFQIASIGSENRAQTKDEYWLERELKENRRFATKHRLSYA